MFPGKNNTSLLPTGDVSEKVACRRFAEALPETSPVGVAVVKAKMCESSPCCCEWLSLHRSKTRTGTGQFNTLGRLYVVLIGPQEHQFIRLWRTLGIAQPFRVVSIHAPATVTCLSTLSFPGSRLTHRSVWSMVHTSSSIPHFTCFQGCQSIRQPTWSSGSSSVRFLTMWYNLF